MPRMFDQLPHCFFAAMPREVYILHCALSVFISLVVTSLILSLWISRFKGCKNWFRAFFSVMCLMCVFISVLMYQQNHTCTTKNCISYVLAVLGHTILFVLSICFIANSFSFAYCRHPKGKWLTFPLEFLCLWSLLHLWESVFQYLGFI